MTTSNEEIIEKILKKKLDIKEDIDSQAFLFEKDLMLKAIQEATKEKDKEIEILQKAKRDMHIEDYEKCQKLLQEKDKEFLEKIDSIKVFEVNDEITKVKHRKAIDYKNELKNSIQKEEKK